MIVRKKFVIKIVYSELRRFVATCKWSSYTSYMVDAKINNRSGFILREYNKKHDCRLTNKIVKVASTWVVTKIKNQVVVDPNVKNDII